MSSGDTRPTEPLPEWAVPAERTASRRRRVWPWLVGLGVFVLLAVVAAVVGEWVARETVTRTVRAQVADALELPEDQTVEVAVAGLVLPQLIAGTLDELTVSGDDLPLGPLTGDVVVVAEGVPVRGDAPARRIGADLTLEADQVAQLLTGLDGFPDAEVTLDEPDVRFDTSFEVFGLEIPVGVSLTPTAAEGAIALSPAGIEVAGARLTADQVRDQFGLIASVVLQDWTICVAEYLPAGVTLDEIAVVGDRIVVDAAVDGAITVDEQLQEPGTCD
ncbi:LmeA family phospholipid-binding protein [Microbacterium xanthum]|uniref:LmeA family phospholipid-binding protein n=1 Tax=Microbacterium xanthum TaxID=3079794 RepID=UPI002AD41947|nr:MULTISPECIES: LmeA family phospholipid-binding protein [unclassified Microbacterium]MDZ8171222.1 LmeA family phospholipid-binding protein [Microbacterium sp. KSW-48]MDZ8201715.1 LmeA family phospholipid-binding protein [Microbacterium sp. SSW1-59]